MLSFFFFFCCTFSNRLIYLFSSAHLLGRDHIHPFEAHSKTKRCEQQYNNNEINRKKKNHFCFFSLSHVYWMLMVVVDGLYYYYSSSYILYIFHLVKIIVDILAAKIQRIRTIQKKEKKKRRKIRTMNGKKRRQNGIARFHFQFHELKNSSSFLSIQFEWNRFDVFRWFKAKEKKKKKHFDLISICCMLMLLLLLLALLLHRFLRGWFAPKIIIHWMGYQLYVFQSYSVQSFSRWS